MQLLILEDDPQVARGLAEALVRDGHQVEHCANPSDADRALNRTAFDAAIIDLGLPGEDGLSFIRRMRAQGVSLPMLILTARDTLGDCVSGLDSGADDYLTKPYRLPELLARLRAAVRRQNARSTSILHVGRLQVNLNTHEVLLDEKPFDLTPRLRVVLECLMMASPNLVRKDKLMQSLAGIDNDVTANAVEVYVSRLRPKLQALGLSVRTVRGIGYRLEEAEA